MKPIHRARVGAWGAKQGYVYDGNFGERRNKKTGLAKGRQARSSKLFVLIYSWGPAETSALPASLPSYFAKFLMKRSARSFALVSHSEASA